MLPLQSYLRRKRSQSQIKGMMVMSTHFLPSLPVPLDSQSQLGHSGLGVAEGADEVVVVDEGVAQLQEGSREGQNDWIEMPEGMVQKHPGTGGRKAKGRVSGTPNNSSENRWPTYPTR